MNGESHSNTCPVQNLGPVVKRARTDKGLSIRRLSERSNVPRTTIERIEQEKLTRPRPDILATLGRTLDIPIADLYALVGYPAPHELPSLGPYLRARYHGLSPQAVAEIDIYFRTLAEREGIILDDPQGGEDETR